MQTFWCALQGRVAVNSDTGELKLLVKINAKSQGAEAKKSKAVKDLKQLSGRRLEMVTDECRHAQTHPSCHHHHHFISSGGRCPYAGVSIPTYINTPLVMPCPPPSLCAYRW